MSVNMTSPMLSGRSLVEVTTINVRRTLIGGEPSENRIKGSASRLLVNWEPGGGRGEGEACQRKVKAKILRHKFSPYNSA